MKTLFFLLLVSASMFAQGKVILAKDAIVQYAPLAVMNGQANLVQGLIGVQTAAGTGTPCVSPGVNGCFGTPPGTVVVQQDLFLPPSVGANFYATFQTGKWSGSGSVSFEIVESGAVVEQITVVDVPILPNSTILVSTSGVVPNNGYAGPATFTATTTATLEGGHPPVTLKASIGLRMIP